MWPDVNGHLSIPTAGPLKVSTLKSPGSTRGSRCGRGAVASYALALEGPGKLADSDDEAGFLRGYARPSRASTERGSLAPRSSVQAARRHATRWRRAAWTDERGAR